ncbi:hypothetical protein COV53_05715 [Candidatus Gottesmanbacteria bacterium CG11_big_fil_rev_8_21_14_0_20_37_11]|uniref:Uncharacterized protein n=1 Tax=Candidatus Gottesmanbacteria bacterium CG11_big_fil_rev_8_21_14_0_20_37_11 TaxID=1974575 RepID=A0A2H0NGB4_9BACT|nr:MAG: hypothetical protein COV53_05715 [Candidatus Gottesmanbacteria bacterium CG11_big_fil_rev_8_21_14_0_20_37_11]
MPEFFTRLYFQPRNIQAVPPILQGQHDFQSQLALSIAQGTLADRLQLMGFEVNQRHTLFSGEELAIRHPQPANLPSFLRDLPPDQLTDALSKLHARMVQAAFQNENTRVTMVGSSSMPFGEKDFSPERDRRT